MKSIGAMSLVVGLFACFALIGTVAAQGKGTCYECYAHAFQKAVGDRDVDALRELVNSPGLLDKENIALAIGDEASSFHSFFEGQKITLSINSIDDGSKQEAMITFVHTSALPPCGLDCKEQLGALRPYIDFIACKVSIEKGRMTMPEHFCFAETDAFEND